MKDYYQNTWHKTTMAGQFQTLAEQLEMKPEQFDQIMTGMLKIPKKSLERPGRPFWKNNLLGAITSRITNID